MLEGVATELGTGVPCRRVDAKGTPFVCASSVPVCMGEPTTGEARGGPNKLKFVLGQLTADTE